MSATIAKRGERLRSLDGLRALAVVLVFAHHVAQKALPGGFIGVDVFFVLSGYLITYLLLAELDRYGSIDLERFYLRRALRLYPALVVVVLVVVVVSSATGMRRSVPDGLVALTYLTDFWGNVDPHLSLLAHTWSLSVEEQFYLVWPALVIYSQRRGWNLTTLVWALIVASLVITFGVHEAHLRRFDVIQYLPTSHIAELGAGILLAIQARAGFHPVTRRVAHPAVAGIALVLMVAAEGLLKAYWWAFPFDTLICFPLVACLVIHPSSAIARGFSCQPLVWLGERSYGFYLWHYPILIFMLIHGVAIGYRIVGGLALTLVLTIASWQLVEQPFLRRKAQLERVPDSSIADAGLSGVAVDASS